MSRAMEEMCNDVRIENALKMINGGKLTLKEITEYSGLSLEKVKESSLEDTLQAALDQIAKKQYKQALISKGVPAECIRAYGFAFEGKQVLIGN